MSVTLIRIKLDCGLISIIIEPIIVDSNGTLKKSNDLKTDTFKKNIDIFTF